MTTPFDYDANPERFRLAARVTRQHLVAAPLRSARGDAGRGRRAAHPRHRLRRGCPAGGAASAIAAAAGRAGCLWDHAGRAHPPPVVQADATDLPFLAGVFDAGVAVNVLDHLADPAVAIGEPTGSSPRGNLCRRHGQSTRLSGARPVWRPSPSSFDAEDAPGLVGLVFAQVQVQRWDAPLVRLPDRDAVRDYLVARFVPSEAAANEVVVRGLVDQSCSLHDLVPLDSTIEQDSADPAAPPSVIRQGPFGRSRPVGMVPGVVRRALRGIG
jgi:Methyltransferase domain